MRNELLTEAAKVSPPAAVAAAPVFGMQPSDWVVWLTIVYLLLQIAVTARKLWGKGKGGPKDTERGDL